MGVRERVARLVSELPQEAQYPAQGRTLFVDLATQAGSPDPQWLARQLSLIYDGAVTSAWMDKDRETAAASRSIAEALVNATLGA